jgi:hypothetical protein
MCESIDPDLRNFEVSVSSLRQGPRTYEHRMNGGEMEPLDHNSQGYLLRKDVCEKSRFVWFSVKQAKAFYASQLLEAGGDAEAPRAERCRRLFAEATELLSAQSDRFLRNVCARRDELERILQPFPMTNAPVGTGC